MIEQPYIPFVPDDWNDVLLLSEAQNLSGSYTRYVPSLRKASDEVKWLRLYPEGRRSLDVSQDDIGVGPWDDGTLKLAAATVWGDVPDRFGVGNAVLWSRADKRKNQPPSEKARTLSRDVWAEFLPILRPRIIVAVGGCAHEVVKGAVESSPGCRIDIVHWKSASPSARPHIWRSWQTEAVRNWRPHVERARTCLGPVRVEQEERAAQYACDAISVTPPTLRSTGLSDV